MNQTGYRHTAAETSTGVVSCKYKREGYNDTLLLPAGGLLHRKPNQ